MIFIQLAQLLAILCIKTRNHEYGGQIQCVLAGPLVIVWPIEIVNLAETFDELSLTLPLSHLSFSFIVGTLMCLRYFLSQTSDMITYV